MSGAANDNAAGSLAVPVGRSCPICGKPATGPSRPFCSKRCADVDLHRWLGGTYRIPTDDDGVEDGPEPADS